MIAGLYNLNPKDPPSLLRFSFDNAGEHFKIQQAIFAQKGISLPLLPIDPIPMDDLLNWARSHQAMHSGANSVLGLQGNDLTELDPEKPEEWAEWAWLHAQEHVRFGLALRLT